MFPGSQGRNSRSCYFGFQPLRLAHASHLDSLSRMRYLSLGTLEGHPVKWAYVIEEYNEEFNRKKTEIDANIDRVEDPSAKAALQNAFSQIKLYHIHWCEQTTWYYKSYLQPVWVIFFTQRKAIHIIHMIGVSTEYMIALFIGAIGALIGLPNRAKLFKVPFAEAKGVHVAFIIMMVSFCVFILLQVLYWKVRIWAYNEEKLCLDRFCGLARLAEENWNERVFFAMPKERHWAMLLDEWKQRRKQPSQREAAFPVLEIESSESI
ncbi:hypothetical protein PUMCH_001649 [Australozyma saopauloensis]|uniref:Uncharacterized protein n=1 Tax=Australozyma saopauloensis TaxID=291208 RepID=A0AAX4H7J0_9ASCO|nr:hypothetical protein PUMCH_001649 [[Candida] saopauloensis]